MNETKVQRNYKDTIFRMLFKDKENLLSLYNALNKTDYPFTQTVDECIEEGILAEFLRENRAEAIKVSIYEYDEELHFRTLYEEGVEDGIEQNLRITIRNMLVRGMSDEDIMAIAECGQELIEQVREKI